VLERLTVDDTSLRATPVMALDLHNRDSRNSTVNAGALATTVVVPTMRHAPTSVVDACRRADR
jgi:glutaminase